jgi:putative Holliday junction resolvase
MTTGKPRCLGLDVGDRRIGLAISDPLSMTAAGLETISREHVDVDIDKIADVAKRHHVVEIIIGLPYNLDGTESEHTIKVMSFGRKLARATGLPIIYEDERNISAVRTFNVQLAQDDENRGKDDRQAAAIILQKYLDHKEPPPSA